MPNVHGVRTSVVVDGFDLAAFINRSGLQKQKSMIDTTVYQPDTVLPTISRIGAVGDGSFAIGGFWDGAETTGIDARADAQLNGGQIAMTLGPNGTAVGSWAYLAMLRQSAYKTDSSIGTAVFFSLDAQPDNTGIRNGYYLRQKATQGGSALIGTAVDWGASSTSSNGFLANLHVFDMGSAVSLDVKLQDSADGVTFVDVTGGAFATVTAVGGYQVRGTASLRRYVRISVTGGQTATYLVAAAKL